MSEYDYSLLKLLTDIRFACGDNGLRMQDELIEYIRQLKMDADRYAWLNDSPESFDVLRQMSTGELTGNYVDDAIDFMMLD
jgi:hypothetical protein